VSSGRGFESCGFKVDSFGRAGILMVARECLLVIGVGSNWDVGVGGNVERGI